MSSARLILSSCFSTALLMGCGTEVIPVSSVTRPNIPALEEPVAERDAAATALDEAKTGAAPSGATSSQRDANAPPPPSLSSPADAGPGSQRDAGGEAPASGAVPPTRSDAATAGAGPSAAVAPSADASPSAPAVPSPDAGAIGCSKPVLTPTLIDNFESFDPGGDPTSAEKWTHGNLLSIVSSPGDASPAPAMAQALSGSKSVLFFDDSSENAPELRTTLATAAIRGSFRASVYIVEETSNRRDTVFTVFGDDTSDNGRITAFRLRSNGTVDRRVTVGGSHVWINLEGTHFAANAWVEVELAWDLSDDCQSVWFSVNDALIVREQPYQDTLAQDVGIRVGDSTGTDATATTFLDDVSIAAAAE